MRRLSERLRGDGVDVVLDTWATVAGDQLPSFMECAVRESDFVLVVCTPEYKRRSDARIGGVGYEGNIITAELLASANERKFIPILRSGEWRYSAPSWCLGKLYVDLSGPIYNEYQYKMLVETLHGRAGGANAPPLGGGVTRTGFCRSCESYLSPAAETCPRCGERDRPFLHWTGMVQRHVEYNRLISAVQVCREATGCDSFTAAAYVNTITIKVNGRPRLPERR